MKPFFIFLGFLISCNFLFAQKNNSQTVFPFTDELPFQINILLSEEIIISGRVPVFTSDECYIAKHDSAGNFMWAKIIGGMNYDYFQKNIEKNNFIVAGGNTNSNSQNFYLVKFTEDGDTVFTKILGGNNYDKLMDIISDEENFILGGHSNSFGTNNSNDLLLIKTDSLGNALWTKSYEANGEDILHSIKKTSDNGFIICGNTTSFGAGMKDIFALKTDSSGNFQWLKTFGATDDEDAIDVAEANGNFFICGYTKSLNGFQDLWILKLNSLGNLLWNETVDFGLNEKGNRIFFRNNKIFVCGYMQSFTGTYDDIFIFAIDENGENISAKNLVFGGMEYGNFLGETANSFFVAGIQLDSAQVKIFELNDTLFSCNSSSINFDTSSVQVIITDTFFTVNSVPVDSLIQFSGGDFSDYGNAYVNADVCFLPEDTTGISKCKMQNVKCKIFPNPSSGIFQLTTSNKQQATITIYNVLGEKVFSVQQITNNEQLTTNLPSGIYFLKITSEDFIQTEKIIITFENSKN